MHHLPCCIILDIMSDIALLEALTHFGYIQYDVCRRGLLTKIRPFHVYYEVSYILGPPDMAYKSGDANKRIKYRY